MNKKLYNLTKTFDDFVETSFAALDAASMSGHISLGNSTITYGGTSDGEWYSGGCFTTQPIWEYVPQPSRSILQEATKAFDTLYGGKNFPPVDIKVDEQKNIYFTFALAGYSKKDIDISFYDDHMILAYKKAKKSKEEKDAEKERPKFVFLKEGIKKKDEFEYKYYLPLSKYDVAKTSASFDEGLLHVMVPIKEEQQPLSISIK